MSSAVADDPHRPGYHFLPPANWLNDPNGLIHWRGEYHLFYQYNPNGAYHGTIHWGHAVSTDLTHWEHLPIALAPEPGGPDADGCWSGCAVDDNGVPTIIYTGFDHKWRQQTCLATSDDNLRTWQKYPGNPVIPGAPTELDVIGFRDHSVWKEGDTWYQVVGSGIRDVGGTALLFKSPDLRQWEYIHPLYVGDKNQTEPFLLGTMWECSDLFALDGRHLLVISVWDNDVLHYPAYFVGTYKDYKFEPDYVQRLDFGGSNYAPQSFRDAAGRRILFGWLREQRSREAQIAAGWSGVMSLPRILTLGPDNVLHQQVAPELESLRGEHIHAENLDIVGGSDVLQDLKGDMLELLATIDPGTAFSVGFALRCSPYDDDDMNLEQTIVVYAAMTQTVSVVVGGSSVDETGPRAAQSGPLILAPGEPLRLHIFLDRSVIEVFANERTVIAERIYPTRPDSLGVGLFATGAARLLSLDAWQLKSIWTGIRDQGSSALQLRSLVPGP